jgi:hypothetical protein
MADDIDIREPAKHRREALEDQRRVFYEENIHACSVRGDGPPPYRRWLNGASEGAESDVGQFRV